VNTAKDRYSYYLPVEVAAAVKEIAASRKVAASDVAAEFLEVGVRQYADVAGLSILLPEVEWTIKTELSKAVERIVRLQVRNTLEAMATRRILLNFMDKQGIERKVIQTVNEAGWQSAVRGIKEPFEELQEIINAADTATRL
jgi:hypothetical protein